MVLQSSLTGVVQAQLAFEEPRLAGPVKTIRVESAKFLLTTTGRVMESPRLGMVPHTKD